MHTSNPHAGIGSAFTAANITAAPWVIADDHAVLYRFVVTRLHGNR